MKLIEKTDMTDFEQSIIDQYENGINIYEILQNHDVNKAVMYRILKRFNIQYRRIQDHSRSKNHPGGKQGITQNHHRDITKKPRINPTKTFPAIKQAHQDLNKIKLIGILRYFQATTLFNTSPEILPETKQILKDLIE